MRLKDNDVMGEDRVGNNGVCVIERKQCVSLRDSERSKKILEAILLKQANHSFCSRFANWQEATLRA